VKKKKKNDQAEVRTSVIGNLQKHASEMPQKRMSKGLEPYTFNK